ncbi:hypothetical protein [Helicobacter winghamensis]|uniref:hypothetical protein n=2 Tax=Helicobacter winghamensis TaxID=157268 RepID=UPI0027A591B8
MQIIAHRGWWESEWQKNQIVAFKKEFDFCSNLPLDNHLVGVGGGVETDIRDYNGLLVISHDIATKDSLSLEEFFHLYSSYNINSNSTLALNIKSDGLQSILKTMLEKYNIQNYFVFDMSIPDALGYIKLGFNLFTRQSEYEKNPSFYNEAKGVWLDEFHSHWINEQIIKEHLNNNKQICIVSPDLHKRDYQKEWQEYKEIEVKLNGANLMLCTDKVIEARRFFNA